MQFRISAFQPNAKEKILKGVWTIFILSEVQPSERKYFPDEISPVFVPSFGNCGTESVDTTRSEIPISLSLLLYIRKKIEQYIIYYLDLFKHIYKGIGANGEYGLQVVQ